MGLAFSNTIAVHIRDAKEGKLVEPSDTDREGLEMYELLMASDRDEDLIIPAAPSISTNLPDVITEYPSPDFTILQRQTIFSLPLLNGSPTLPHISRHPGLDEDISSLAALPVAQLCGSNFVDPTVLWETTYQQLSYDRRK